MSGKWLRALPLLLMLLLALALAFGLFNDKSVRPDSVLVGETIAPFEIPTYGGNPPAFSPAILNGKPILLNVFASWCTPCALEHPLLMRLAKTGKIAIYGIAWRDTETKLTAYLKQHGNPFQMLGMDEHGKSTIPLALTGVPETFLIDKDGVVRYHLNAPLSDDLVSNTILPLVDKLNGISNAAP